MALSGRVTMVLLVVVGLHSAAATQYTVGGNSGWTFQPTSNSTYTDQFKSIKLVVGDTLLFPFQATLHNVNEVTPTQLTNCDFSSPILSNTSGNAVITLATAGVHAYGCAVTGHCALGMQLSVTVQAAAPAPAPTSSPPTPAPAPAKASPGPAPAKASPGPAPAKATPAPAPSPKGPTTAPTPAPSGSVPTTSTPATSGPAPAPSVPGSSGNIISSGFAVVMAVIVGGLSYVLV